MTWRTTRCDGCWRRCSYRNFQDPANQGLKNGEILQEAWSEILTQSSNPDDWPSASRATVLGRLHQSKRGAWKGFMDSCPYHGDDLGPGRLFGRMAIQKWLSRRWRRWLAVPLPQRPERCDLAEAVLDVSSGTCMSGLARLVPDKDGKRRQRYAVWWRTGVEMPYIGPLFGDPYIRGVVEDGRLRDVAQGLATTLNVYWRSLRVL